MKLTPQIHDRLVLAARAGNYREAMAAYAGVARSTFFLWLQRGKAKKGKEYVKLLTAIEQAEMEAEAQMVMVWRTHMKSDYRAIRDFLERRYYQRWGKRETVTHEGAVPVAGSGAPDSILGRIANDPVAMSKYNDLLSALSETSRRESGGASSPS